MKGIVVGHWLCPPSRRLFLNHEPRVLVPGRELRGIASFQTVAGAQQKGRAGTSYANAITALAPISIPGRSLAPDIVDRAIRRTKRTCAYSVTAVGRCSPYREFALR